VFQIPAQNLIVFQKQYDAGTPLDGKLLKLGELVQRRYLHQSISEEEYETTRREILQDMSKNPFTGR